VEKEERGKREFFFFCCVAVEVFFALSERERESAGRFRARIVPPLEKEFALLPLARFLPLFQLSLFLSRFCSFDERER